jgi:hypothetical protein
LSQDAAAGASIFDAAIFRSAFDDLASLSQDAAAGASFFDAAIFRSAFDDLASLSQDAAAGASEEDTLELLIASGVVVSIGTAAAPVYCTNVNLDEPKDVRMQPGPQRPVLQQHCDVQPDSADVCAPDADVSAASSVDPAPFKAEFPTISDAVHAVAAAVLACLKNMSALVMQALPSEIAALPSPWRALDEQAAGITRSAALFAKFLCTMSRMLPTLSSRSEHLLRVANALNTRFEICGALLLCGQPSVAMNALVPLASAAMDDSCGVGDSARLTLLSLAAHALILNGCLSDASTLLRRAALLNDAVPDDSNTQSKWLFAVALHHERKVFQDYGGCEDVSARCLALKCLHPHARILISLMQLSVKPVMMKLSGSSHASRSFAWPVYLQTVDKFVLPAPLLLLFQCCASQFTQKPSPSPADTLAYQEHCVTLVKASFSLRLPKIAVNALFNLKTAWAQEQVVCARILASVADVCRALEFQALLLQAYDAFMFFKRRIQVRISRLLHTSHVTRHPSHLTGPSPLRRVRVQCNQRSRCPGFQRNYLRRQPPRPLRLTLHVL